MADVVLDDEVVVIVEVDDPSVVLEISGQGTPGAPGKSAYEVAVDNGFIGTEQEWLDSLNTDVVAVIETWASIPDNTLGILDPETATDTVAELLGQFGATQEIIDQAVGGLSFFVPYLDPEQPSDVKAAIRNIANWLTFIIVQIFSINGQLSPINSQLSDLASQISGILDNLSGYGDIVTHNVSEFATSAQGIKADTALQPEDLPDPDSNGLHLDIRDFGAAVDGLTDDWQAIMDTITEAVATSRPVYIPAGTTFIRRAVVVPSGVEIFGAGIDKSIVKRKASVGSAMVGVVGFNSTEVEVESAVDFAVGDPIHMWDLAFYEGDDVLRTITSIEDNVIHFSPSTSSDYSATSMGRVSTSTSVFRSESGAEHINIYGLTVDQSMNEFDPKGSYNNGDSQTEFTLAAIHLEGARHCKVERVKFINAFGDAYSDQGRGTYDDPNHNEIGWCVFDSPYRHAIHLGSGNYGSRVHHNLVTGVISGYCMFYCAEVVNCEVSGNYFTDSTTGLAHIDDRDKHSIITDNYFINVGVAINVQGDTTVDDFSVLIANNMFWNDQNVPVTPGITIKLPGALFNGNRLHNSFLRIADGGNRSIVTDNVFTQSQDSDDRIAGLDWQVWLEAQDVVFSDNRMDYAWGGVQVMGAHRLVASGNSFSNMVNKELDFAYYDTSDCVIDGPPVKITYTDGGTATRLIYNNLGNNGTDDPAVGGDWNSISDSKYEGTAVTWLGNGAQQISRFIDGQWVNLASASKIEDIITDGVTSKAPSQNAVFDALSLKVPTSRTLAGLDLSSNITASQLRTALALVIGTDVQAFHSNLTLLSDLTAAADRIPYFTGSNSAALLTLDTDVTLSGNSDTSLSTQKAVKGYVDTRIPIHRGATSFSGMKISTRSALVASQAVAGSAGSGRILYTPIFLPAGTYNTISIVTTVAGTSTWRLGVYNHASGDTTRPGTVAVDAGTVSTSGTPGALTISGLNLVVANDDWYWCAAQVDAYTSNPTIVAMSGQAGQDLLPFYGWPGQMASYLRGYAGFQDFGVSTGSLATARSITNNTSTGVAYAQDVPRFWIGA